jgi:hypothetical protein
MTDEILQAVVEAAEPQNCHSCWCGPWSWRNPGAIRPRSATNPGSTSAMTRSGRVHPRGMQPRHRGGGPAMSWGLMQIMGGRPGPSVSGRFPECARPGRGGNGAAGICGGWRTVTATRAGRWCAGPITEGRATGMIRRTDTRPEILETLGGCWPQKGV